MKRLHYIINLFRRQKPKPFNEAANWKRLMEAAHSGVIRDFCQKQYHEALEDWVAAEPKGNTTLHIP